MIGFQGQNAHPIEAMANRLNRLGNRLSGFPCPVEVRSREAQKPSLSPSSFLFPIEPHPCPVEATVTCHALNALTASDPVDPLLVRSRLLSAVFVSRA